MDEQATRINSFLLRHKSSFDVLSKSKQRQLVAIDTAIQKRLDAASEAKAILKDSKINVSTIAEDTKIARKTFYNNDILKAYIEEYTSSASDDETASASDLDKAEAKIAELTQQVNGFVMRDINTQNLWHENNKLLKEIEILNTRCENLTKENVQLHSENSKLKAKIPTSIVEFPSDKSEQ